MKRIAYILFFVVISTSINAQMHGYSLNFGLSKRDFCDTIPIVFEDNQVYIPVMMNGTKHLFNLDTGSSQGMINAGAHIGYWRELGNVVSRDANNRMDTVKVIALPDFSIGSLTVTDYVASVIESGGLGRKYDAIIGFDLFNKGLCGKIDVAKRVMILTDRRHLFDNEEGYGIKYKLKWFVPHLLVSPFIRHDDEVLFDLGARQLYTMNKQSFDKHAYKSKNVNSQVEGIATGSLSIGVHGAESEDEVAFLNLDRLQWDDFAFNRVRAVTTSGSSRIGGQILNYGAIIINPFKRQIIFQPYSGKDSVSVDNKQFDMAFVPVNGRPTVGLIFDKSEAYLKGVRQGDVILRINGRLINTFNDFVYYPFVERQVYNFTFEDKQGVIKNVRISR